MALWGVVPCLAQSSEAYENWLVEGNAAYNEGNYDQALTLYGQIEEAGVVISSKTK